jgi:hypothetical protein
MLVKPKISMLYRPNKPVFSLFLDGKEIDQIYRTNKLKDAISDRQFLKYLPQNALKQIKVERLKTI